jgi:hypothetical protein
MLEFAIALLVLLFIVTAMSVGVIMGRKPITGSCGGVGAALGQKDYTCEFCGDDPARCEESGERQNLESQAYEVGGTGRSR